MVLHHFVVPPLPPGPLDGSVPESISKLSRAARVLSTLGGCLALAAIVQTEWSRTTNLGRAGGLCNDAVPASACSGQATFGLSSFCVEAKLPLLGNATEFVCVDYDTRVLVLDSAVANDGLTRFKGILDLGLIVTFLR